MTHRSIIARTTELYTVDNDPSPWPEKIVGPTVWDGHYYEAHPEEWIYQLTQEDINEIDHAVKHFLSLNKPLVEIERNTFPLPQFSKTMDKIKKDLLAGRGFSLLRGFPIQKYNREEQAVVFMGLGSHFGHRKAQNMKGHILGHVKDITIGSQTKSIYNPDDPTTRIYTTRKAQPFHVDGTDIVGLMCLQKSAEGGESSLISSHTLYNHLMQHRPDIIEMFKQNWHWDKKGEQSPGSSPYIEGPPMVFHKGKLLTFHSPHFLETVTRLGIPVEEKKFEALKYVQEYCERESLKMWLEVGDMQFVHNHHLLHARSAYKDSEEFTRHLLRLWLVVPIEEGGWEMPSTLQQRGVYFYDVDHTLPLEAE